jgi:hypothetical protein
MRQALADLEAGRSFGEVIERWSSDPGLRTTKGVSPPFPVSDRSPLGEIAMQMDIGQRYGPLRTSEGEIYFELIAKDSANVSSDTSLAARFARARDELLRMKGKRLLTMLLARSGKERGFDVYADRLEKLDVSPIPMMTFRILGFGGRMFAVPFVEPQLDWLDVTPPDTEVLP